MALSISQIRAASALARGSTDTAAIEAAGVARATFYKWAKQKDFTAAVQLFTARELEHQAQLTAAADSADDVAQAYQDEQWLKQQLRGLLEQKLTLVTDVLAGTEAETISPRQIPQLVQSVTTLIDSFRTSNDRIAGLENLIHELSKIEASRAKAMVDIASASESPEAPG